MGYLESLTTNETMSTNQSLLSQLKQEHQDRQERIRRAAIPENRLKVTDKLEITGNFEIILYEVCRYYQVREIDILSLRRQDNLPEKRHILSYMLWRMTTMTNSQIAKKLSRDITSIGYAIKKIKKKTDIYQKDIKNLEDRISVSLKKGKIYPL